MKRTALMIMAMLSLTTVAAQQSPIEKYRVLISTDIGGTDPDDNQSMAHLLMFTDKFELEGLVSSPSYGSGSASEIYRMIDIFEKDYSQLCEYAPGLMTPYELRPLVKQGRIGRAPACGYGKPTEGSQWIVTQARKDDARPLYVLVWGGLEDVAQALHDAPDIAPKLRVHWIGGPNKKWSVNTYCYIIEHFPDLWMIENNTTYRAFIYDSKNKDEWNTGYFDKHIRDAGYLGRDFAAYYKGNPKMGDTPTLLYMMKGNPANPEAQSLAGRFVPCRRTPRSIYYGATTAKDTTQICGIIEWQLKGPARDDIAVDSACLTLDIRGQKWEGYYKGNGNYVLRHSTYYIGTLDYTITSTIKGFKPIKGQITVENTWDTAPKSTDYITGREWWTDSYAPADYWNGCAGAMTQYVVREESMRDWAERWAWLKDDVYLFTSFREPSTDGLEYLYSYDELRWDTISGVFLHPQIGNFEQYTDAFTGEKRWPKYAPEKRCFRDPSVIKGNDGKYHMVWTTQWSGSRFFGYACSDDLVHWSEQREIHVMDSIPTNNVWAPELFYDDELELYFIIWSSQIDPKEYTAADKLAENACHRLWYTTTRDFKTFAPAKRYYDPGFNSIDGYLLKRAPKDYVLVLKDNRRPGYSNIFCAFSDSPYGPFHSPTESFGRTYSEGPCAVKHEDGEWIIYFDQYHPEDYGAVSTRDFKTFTLIPDRISVPLKHKHGTILRISQAEFKEILKHQH
ncbi:MAG: nucleoside hydrolase-like domain-containing protein [Prevotella sp.]